MGLFSNLFHKKSEKSNSVSFNVEEASNKKPLKGNVSTSKIQVTGENISDIKHCFIAFDTETTGRSAENDVIIEVGAVKFIDGQVVDTYGSLINEGVPVPPSASRVNHISTEMLQKNGKKPSEAYKELVDFLGDAMQGKIYICAHNATFDISFLRPALERNGYNGSICYIDTLQLSRQLIKNLPNYKQTTIMSYFDILNPEEHRALSDAEVCGKILVDLLHLKSQSIEIEEKARQEQIKKAQLKDNERYVFAILLNGIKRAGLDIGKLCAYRNSSGYVDLVDVITIFKFKIAKKKAYVLIPKKYMTSDMNVEPAVKSEGGDDLVRLLFKNPFELDKYNKIFGKIYHDILIDQSSVLNKYESEFLSHAYLTKLTDEEIASSIDEAKVYMKQNAEEKAAAIKTEKEKIAVEEQKKKEKEKHKREIDQNKKEKAAEAEREKELIQEMLNSDDEITNEYIKKLVNFSKLHGKRAVLQIDDDGHIIKAFLSVADASKAANIAPKTIRDVANGKYKHGGGFCWMYADEKNRLS